jgi:signal peptidase I
MRRQKLELLQPLRGRLPSPYVFIKRGRIMDNQDINRSPDTRPEEDQKTIESRSGQMVEDIISKRPAKQPLSFKNELFEWAEMATQVLITIVLVFIFLVRNTGVQGGSMKPTLHDGDSVIISNLFYTPEQGDIVVLTKYGFEAVPGKVSPIVKRVIATSGQVVDIDFENNVVSVDGVELDEPYINEPTQRSGDMKFPAKVPEGCIFVMGDNRNHSTDSRWSDVGMVDTRMVLGRVLFKIPLSGLLGRKD